MRQTRDNRIEELSNNTVDPLLPAGHRALPVARDVEGVTQFGYPVLSEAGSVRRNLVTVDGVNNGSGLWTFACPGIIGGTASSPELYALNNLAKRDPNFKEFVRWQLPDGSKKIPPGTTGIILAGTSLDEDRVIFHPDANSGLRTNHHSIDRPDGESIVYGTDSSGQMGIAAGLSTAFFEVDLPPTFGNGAILALNAMSLEDESLDGNMSFVFNKVAQYAQNLGTRIISMGAWNRNGPFAADPTNQTELGVNYDGVPFRAMMQDYRTSKFGNPEQSIDAPAPLCFDDSRYARDSEKAPWKLSMLSEGGHDRPTGGLILSAPFFGKGCFFLDPDKQHLAFDADGNVVPGYGEWIIEVEEHIITAQTTAGGGKGGQVQAPPGQGGGAQGGKGPPGTKGPPPGGPKAPPPPGGGVGNDKKDEPKGKPQGNTPKDDGNAAKKKCKQQKGPRKSDGKHGESNDIGPRPPGVPPSIWKRIQSIQDRIAKAKRRGHTKREAALKEALAKARAKKEKYKKRAAARAKRAAALKNYGTTNEKGQERVRRKRALAKAIAAINKSCMSQLERHKARVAARAAHAAGGTAKNPPGPGGGGGGGAGGGGAGGGTDKGGGNGGGRGAIGGGATGKSIPSASDALPQPEESDFEKTKKAALEENERQKAAALKEAEGNKGGATEQEKEEIEKEYERRRKILKKAKTEADVRRAVGATANLSYYDNQMTDGPIIGERNLFDVQTRQAAGMGTILPSMVLDKMMMPGLDFMGVTADMRENNTTAAADSRTIDEHLEQGYAPSTICLTPVHGFGVEVRDIKNIAQVSALVFHAPDVDPTADSGQGVVDSAIVIRDEVTLYIGGPANEGTDADNDGPARDCWSIARGVDGGGNATLEIDCIDDDGNHDANKSVTIANTLYDKNGDEILGGGGALTFPIDAPDNTAVPQFSFDGGSVPASLNAGMYFDQDTQEGPAFKDIASTPQLIIDTSGVHIPNKLTVDGLIDPTGMEFAQQAANPGGVAADTIYIDSSDGRIRQGSNILAYASDAELVPNSAFNQTGHGLPVGTPVLFDGTDYKSAKADLSSTTAVMLVSEVTDVDNIKVANDGKLTLTDVQWKVVTGGDSLIAGSKYYLSQATDGEITLTKPTSGIVQYLGYAESVTVMQLDIDTDAVEASSGGSAGQAYYYGARG